MPKPTSIIIQQKNDYSKSRNFIEAIKKHSVTVTGDLDYVGIHATVMAVLPNADFEILAKELVEAAHLFGIEWTTASWWFTNGSGNRPVLYMTYQAPTFHGDIDLERSIHFTDRTLIADHDILGLPQKLQGNDFSRMVNGILYRFYIKNGFKKIRTKAGLDAGGYVWASAGFSATRQEDVEKIIADAYTNLPLFSSASLALIEELEEDVSEHYSSLYSHEPYPIYQWLTFGSREALEEVLKGSKWHGELNLEDGVQTFTFEKYVDKYKHLIT